MPLLIRAGKCLPVTATEVTVRFKKPPHDVSGLGDAVGANALRFRIYPEDRATLTLLGKKPDDGWQPEVQDLTFTEHPGTENPVE